ncbi:hypothetical protein AB0D30_23815 [Streptomyces sp. NPDC048409]|uniref:hypothetical protein n=1 Tax=Streptomyces sp. NPDC048409 TaxID=3154723 RepID=UPI003445FA3B
MFTSVRQHFDEPRVRETVFVNVSTDTEGSTVGLTAAETYEVLYGSASSPPFAAAVWEEVLRTALSDHDPHSTPKLLVIWLTLPRLTGTVHRICTRLRADRSDVESEMVLALLEELAAPDAPSHLSDSSLIQAARTRAWHFARAGLREFSSTQVEFVAQDRAVAASDGEADAATEEYLDVRVDRPESPDGLHAPLRFRVRPQHLHKDAFADTGNRTTDDSTRYSPYRKPHSGRQVHSRPVHPAERRA